MKAIVNRSRGSGGIERTQNRRVNPMTVKSNLE